MPGESTPGNGDSLNFLRIRRSDCDRKINAYSYLRVPVSAVLLSLFSGTSAYAVSSLSAWEAMSGLFGFNLATFEITMLAVFGGAVSFALMSASWLIRQRTAIASENKGLKRRLADLRAAQEQMSALLQSTDQQTVVWNGTEEKPELYGKLSEAPGVPTLREEFLAFGSWLDPDSALRFDASLKKLRQNAEAFIIPLTSKTGSVLEADGRTSGGFAYVRFSELGGAKAELANIREEHKQLVSIFQALQKLFDHLDIPIWLRNKAGKLVWVNSAYTTAVDAENASNAIKMDLQLLDSSERNEIARSHENGDVFSGRLPAVVAGDRCMLDIVDVLANNGSAGLGIDKSEVEEVNRTLRKTIKSHARMLDHLTTAVAIFDGSKTLQFYNSAFATLWKLDNGFLDNQPTHTEILDNLRANSKLPEQSDWRKWMQSQTSVYQALEPLDERWHLPDGTALRNVISPQEQGGVFWTSENLTEQFALEGRYKTLMKVQGETLDHLNEAVAVFGSDGRLKLANPAFSELIEDKNLPEQPVVEIGEHIKTILEAFAARLVDRDVISQLSETVTGFEDHRNHREGRLELIDGKIIDYVLVPLPQGQTLITLFDSTDSVNVERALQERAEAFEASDLLKTKFIQHVSYQLRAPLTNISGFGEMLSQEYFGALNEKQAEYVGSINESCHSLKAIVDDILDLAKVDAGAIDLNLTKVDLNDSISTSLDELSQALSKTNLAVDVELDPESQSVIADPERLQQIMFNLVANAVEASPENGRVEIRSRALASEIEISISDEGPGVPAEMRNLIFNRFESMDTKNRRKGTGLGLSIVQSFVQLHGGTVHVEEGEKGGARFICRLPKEPAQLLEAAQ